MSLWVLDTDHLSFFQQNHPIVKQRVNALNSEEVAITIITVEEQLYGRLNRIRRAKSADELVTAYARMCDLLEDIKNINILDFDQEAYNCYTELVRQKVRIGTQDLRIAACVISRSGVLVTRNRRDFERVPALRFEDWTI
ncbi:type II toxin-antitoxin system VapC family toxin [Phormidium nigroviride]